MKTIEQIRQLISNKKFSEADNALWEIKREGDMGSLPDYLLGCLYSNYENPNRSTEEAKKHFLINIKSEEPIEDAFLRLATLEKNHVHTMRILNQGLSYFPKSVHLYMRLLNWSNIANRETIYQKMEEKGVNFDEAKAVMILTYIECKLYNKALELIAKYVNKDSEQEMILKYLQSLCLLETGSLAEAFQIFEWLVEADLGQTLCYAQYFGLTLIHLRQQELKKAIRVFNDIPIDYEFESPYDMDFGPLDQPYIFLSNLAISELLKTTKSKKTVAKARGIRSLIGYYEGLGTNQQRRKQIADLSFANKYFPSNKKFCQNLAYYAIQDKEYYKAHTLTIQYLRNVSFDELGVISEIDYGYVTEASKSVFTEIYSDLLNSLRKRNYTDVKVFSCGPCVPVIERLFKEKKYDVITEYGDTLGDMALKVSEILFEVAYSYSETGKQEKAKTFYEKNNNINPNSPAVLNNLGVLYEEEGDYSKAKEFYQKALSLDNKSELYNKNLKRICDLEHSASNITKADLYVKRNLITLWCARDINNYLPDPKSLLKKSLSISAKDAGKAFHKLVKEGFLVKVKNKWHNYNCEVYFINSYIVPTIPTIEKEVDRTIDLIAIAEKITPESFLAIGYDDQLTTSLKRVTSYDLQQLLQRDMREAAFSLLARSYKTTLVLTGSIIEAVLLDHVLAKGISKYTMQNGKKRIVSKMSLGDLLFVTQSEGIIDIQLFHLAQALRGFRNLIHPGVEKRKSAISVNEQNAKIAWDITRKLISEI